MKRLCKGNVTSNYKFYILFGSQKDYYLLQLLLWSKLARSATLLLSAVRGSLVHASIALSANKLILVGLTG